MINVTQKEICRLFDISAPTCAVWIKDGMPKRGKLYDVQSCFKWKYKDEWLIKYLKAVELLNIARNNNWGGIL